MYTVVLKQNGTLISEKNQQFKTKRSLHMGAEKAGAIDADLSAPSVGASIGGDGADDGRIWHQKRLTQRCR